MDSTMIKKQAFLRKEILDEAIDPNQFMEYMQAVDLHKGSDLELWKMSELRRLVKDFKEQRQVQEIDRPTSNPYSNILQSNVQKSTVISAERNLNKAESTPIINSYNSNPYQSSAMVAKQQLSKNPNLQDDTIYIDQIKCEVIQPSKFKDMNIDIKVTKYEKIEGGPFERSYVLYTVEIHSLKSIVSRRYSDFVWLREVFMMMHPGYPIPPAAKKGNFKRYDDKYLNKKRIILQKFLNHLLNIPQIAADPLFQNFLLIREQKDFEKYKSQYSKLTPLPPPKIKTLTGFVTLATEKNICSKREKYEAHLKATQPEMKKIYKNFKGAATCLEGAAQSLQATAANCKFIRDKNQAVRIDLQLPSVQANCPFVALQKFCKQYAFQMLNQAKTFRQEIYSLTKYESLYQLNMIEAMQQLNNKQQQYNQEKLSLLKKKEKLYAQGRLDRWGLQAKITVKPNSKQQCLSLMLPKQTKELLLLRQNYGLYNYSIYEQCVRHTKRANKIMANYLRQFLDDQFKISSTTTMIFEDILHKITEIEKFHIQLVP